MKIQMIALVLLLSLTGCNKSSDSPSATAAVEGIDYSGTYSLKGVECYNSSLTTLTNSATWGAGYSDVVTLTGNTLTEVATYGSCTVNYTGKVVVLDSLKMNITGLKISSVTGGSCSQTKTLSNPSITPSASTNTYSTGQSLSDTIGAIYIYNSTSKVIGLLSTYSDGSGGYCFITYTRQ